MILKVRSVSFFNEEFLLEYYSLHSVDRDARGKKGLVWWREFALT